MHEFQPLDTVQGLCLHPQPVKVVEQIVLDVVKPGPVSYTHLTANVTPEQLAALLRQSATATPNPAALSAVGATFEKEVDADED